MATFQPSHPFSSRNSRSFLCGTIYIYIYEALPARKPPPTRVTLFPIFHVTTYIYARRIKDKEKEHTPSLYIARPGELHADHQKNDERHRLSVSHCWFDILNEGHYPTNLSGLYCYKPLCSSATTTLFFFSYIHGNLDQPFNRSWQWIKETK